MVAIFCFFISRLISFTLLIGISISSSFAFEEGTVRPLANGDTVITKNYSGNPIGNADISFEPHASLSTRIYSIGNDGLQHLLYRDNRIYITYADNGGTVIFFRGKAIPPERRFVRFPSHQPLRPGMEWDVQPITNPPYSVLGNAGYTSCGEEKFIYRAKSEEGPAFSVLIDGKPTVMQDTVRVRYEADVRACRTVGPVSTFWKKTAEIIYSQELKWIVSARYINYTVTRLADSGSGWDLVAIQTAKSGTAPGSLEKSSD